MGRCFGRIQTRLLGLHKVGASKELRTHVTSAGNLGSLRLKMPGFGQPLMNHLEGFEGVLHARKLSEWVNAKSPVLSGCQPVTCCECGTGATC